jgi:ABC-type branched-subunit amino acid transport system substrate-binding protein
MYKTITLSRWFLKGSPDTWRAQLEEYNRKQPVFALLGGISNGSWKPIHDFSEENRIPCLFPQTNFPVVSGTDWYTHYFSKGYYQEGEAAARYLNGQVDVIKPGNVLQLVRITPEGEALSAGFKDTWQDLGHVNLQTETIKDGENLTVEYIQELLARKKPSALILWDGPTAPGILEKITSAPDRPQVVIVSSRYLSDRLTSIPEQARELTYITYPFRLPQDEVRYNFTIESYRKSPKQTEATDPASKQSYILTQLLTQVLMELRGNYYRDNFFDVIGMMKDQDMPLFERLSFGPGQRYASKGCHIVQLGKGQQPNLIKKSDWITF